jgi:hypothetical protein
MQIRSGAESLPSVRACPFAACPGPSSSSGAAFVSAPPWVAAVFIHALAGIRARTNDPPLGLSPERARQLAGELLKLAGDIDARSITAH